MALRRKSPKNHETHAPAEHGAKKAFIMAQPADMKARELIEKAETQGMRITRAYVSVVRSRGNSRSERRRSHRVVTQRRSATSTHVAPLDFSSKEAQLREIAIEIGIGRARQLLSELEQKLRALLDRR